MDRDEKGMIVAPSGIRPFDIADFKLVKVEDGDAQGTYITGYANTKGKEDAYGDVPTNYKGKPVYDFARYKKNPIVLVDHVNSVGNIAGLMVEFGEDDKGFPFKMKLMDNPQTEIVRHAHNAFIQGIGRALSIGGKWYYEDKENPKALTKAIIHEVSLVAIGADGQALTGVSKPKSIKDQEEETKRHSLAVLEFLIGEYKVSKNDEILGLIDQLKEQLT